MDEKNIRRTVFRVLLLRVIRNPQMSFREREIDLFVFLNWVFRHKDEDLAASILEETARSSVSKRIGSLLLQAEAHYRFSVATSRSLSREVQYCDAESFREPEVATAVVEVKPKNIFGKKKTTKKKKTSSQTKSGKATSGGPEKV